MTSIKVAMNNGGGGSNNNGVSAHLTKPEPAYTFGARFNVVDRLGKGSQAKVYLAFDMKRCVQVAVKVVNHAEDRGPREWHEANVMLKLKHPNILRLYAVMGIQSTKETVLITELCDRGTLLELVNDHGPFSEEIARGIFKQIADGLAFAHRNGIAHRDIKLENIFLKQGRRVVIGDWGYACDCRQNPEFFDDWVGSENYCAPELLKGVPYKGPAVDVWAAGVVLYALMHRQLPFYTNSRLLRLHQMYQTGPEFAQGLSNDYMVLVTNMLQPIPEFRINMNDALASRWTANF